MANEVVEILHRVGICVGNIAVKVIANNQDLYLPNAAAAATADDGTRVKGLQSRLFGWERDSWKIIIIIRTIDRRQEASSTFNSRALKRLVHHYIAGPIKSGRRRSLGWGQKWFVVVQFTFVPQRILHQSGC